MLLIQGAPEGEDSRARVTLKECRINGETSGQRSGAPAVITHGYLKLDTGAALYLLADTVQGNQVGESGGYGSDIYAGNGSTIYYPASIQMERESFYLCKDAVLINLDGMLRMMSGEDADIEIFLSVCDGSGYSMDEVIE